MQQYSQGRSRILSHLAKAALLGTATAVHAAIADAAGTQVITAGITNPDNARNITATVGGTGANITATQVTVTGTNIYGDVISETLPVFTAATPGIVTGLKAFATVTSISVPHNGTGVTTSIGTGAKLGLPAKLFRNTVVYAFLNNVREATAPTVVANSTAVESNTVTLNSALNGNDVVIDYYAG